MAPPSRDETERRLDRLAGSGQGSGGGLPLPDLFSALLNEVLDSSPVTTERMTEIASSVLNFKEQAVFATWPSWQALTADVLAQIESRGILDREDSGWTVGPNLVTGRRLEIIPARPGKGSKPDGVTVWTRAEREQRSSAHHAIRTFGELDAEIAQRGSRRVTTARKELIFESIRQLGDLRDFFPVLLDEQGNVVDGRHRREIDPDWPASRMRVPAEQRVAAAAAANRTNAWSERDWKTLLEKVTETTGRKTEAVRTLIRLALLEDASRSDREIGRLVGCSQTTVGQVRRDLEETDQIGQFDRKGGRGITTGTPNNHSDRWVREETVEAVTREAQRRLEAGEPTDFRELADRFGVGRPFAQQRIAVAKDRVEQAARRPEAEAPEPSASSWRSGPAVSPADLMQRISHLLKRWEGESDDTASELEELEALRREIDGRIEALRR
jgi:hypothetical protein